MDLPEALFMHIPSWCKEATIIVNGEEFSREKGGQIIKVERNWKNKDQLKLKLTMEISISTWGRNSKAVERGPLVYALKLSERWEKGHDEVEGEYFSVFPKDAWNYDLLDDVIKDPAGQLAVKKVKPVTDAFIWNLDHAPVEIMAPARKIPDWKILDDVAPQPVTDRYGLYKGEVEGRVENITLVPFGCTKVRVVAFPVVPQ